MESQKRLETAKRAEREAEGNLSPAQAKVEAYWRESSWKTPGLKGIRCFVSEMPRNKKPQAGNYKDLVIASVVLGYPKKHYETHKEFRQNKIDYAKVYGSNYCEMETNDLARSELPPGRGFEWAKIPFLLAMLHRYEYVLWVDADMMIANQCKSLLKIQKAMGTAEFFASEDLQGSQEMNTGVMLFRNGPFSQAMLQRILTDDDLAAGCENAWPFEQKALTRFARQHQKQFCRPDPQFFAETQNHKSGRAVACLDGHVACKQT